MISSSVPAVGHPDPGRLGRGIDGPGRPRRRATDPGADPPTAGAVPLDVGPGGSAAGRSNAGRRSAPGAGRPLAVVAVPPLVRLGALWAVALGAALVEGTVTTALLVAPLAAIATASALRSHLKVGATPRLSPVVLVASAAVPVAALATPALAAVVLLAAGAIGAALAYADLIGVGPVTAIVAVVAPAGAAASLVAARGQGMGLALALAAAVCLYDAANHLMGTGTSGGILGAIAGAATIAVLAVLLAAVLAPPLTGSRPWVLCGMVAVLAPLGPVVARWLSGGRRLPALARLDSLMLAGPAWVVAVAVVLHR